MQRPSLPAKLPITSGTQATREIHRNLLQVLEKAHDLTAPELLADTAIVEFLRELGSDGLSRATRNGMRPSLLIWSPAARSWLDSGPTYEAVRASIALPGIFSPVRIHGQWLIDGGLCNPVPVSVCRALGADMIIAVNLNGDLLGRRFQSQPERTPTTVLAPSQRVLDRVPSRLPAGLREQAAQVAQQLLPKAPSTLGYFDVLANSINIMQDHLTRSRLAGDEEAIAEGRICVEQALPMLRRFLDLR